MAQLKDLIVNGATRLIGDAFANKITISALGDSTGSTGTNGQVLKSNGTNITWAALGGAAGYGVTNNTTATQVLSNNTNLITGSTFYYGLPFINNSHGYTSSTTIYAPTTGGTAGYFLKANGATATPTWSALPVATTSVTGIVLLNSATNSSATNQAATPSAVKAAYELAASKTNNTGTVTSITLKAGGGISLDTDNTAITGSGTRTISHADTSTATNLTANGRTYVTGLSFDTYGHVTAYTTGTETVTNTDTKVTAVGNHYTPATANNTTISATASGATAAWSIDVVKSVSIQKDAAGHITGLSVTSGKIPANPNTNTTYSFAEGSTNGAFSVTPSGGTAQSVKIHGLGSAAYSATSAFATAGHTHATLTIFDKTYTGASATTITAADIGLSSSMTFRGKIKTELSDGSTANVQLEGTSSNMTRNAGDVVIDTANLEYVWDGSKWVQLGFATDFALKQHTHATSLAEDSGTSTITLGYNKKYKLTTGGTNVIFTTPAVTMPTVTVTGSGNAVTNVSISGTTITATKGATYNNYSHPTGDGNLHVPATGTGNNGKFLKAGSTAGSLSWGTAVTQVTAGTGLNTSADQADSATKGSITTTGTLYLTKSGVTAGTYGPSGNVTGSNNTTINVPEIQVDTYGRVTSVTNRVYTSVDTTGSDTKVTQAAAITTTGAYPVILAYSTATSAVTNTVNKAAAFTYNPGTQKLHTPIIEVTTASYGSTLPSSGTAGQLFFQLSNGSMYELPAAGTTGQVLVKNSNADRDVGWASTVTSATNATNTTNAYTSASTVKAYVVGTTVDSSSFKALVHNSSVYTENSVLFGAAWNDYAEFRKDNQNEIQEPGRCVIEQGDGSLALATQRLQRGCEIISDTFGFAIGQDEENGYNTPIAVSGRVLAYVYEGKEAASQHIGWPVCSGPDGTVSIMTEEEEEKYPSRIIGTISEIPNYEYWGAKSVAVKERVWIRIR